MSVMSEYRTHHAAFVARLEQEPEFKIIYTLVQQPNADPNALADKIVEYTVSEVDNPQSMHFYHTAASVMEVARRTAPEHQDKLCEFVLALQQHSVDNSKTKESLSKDGHPKERIWTDLAVFKHTFVDNLQLISGLSKKTRQDAQQDENLNAFVAKLTGCPTKPKLDFAYHGQMMLSDAFHPESEQIPPGCAVHTARLACWWLIHAAPVLWAKVQDPKNENWSLELWNIYKARLLTTQATMRNHEVKKLIELAIAQMEQAEQGKNQ